MSTTCTPGITVLADGQRFIDKRHLDVRIGLRVGAVTQAQAEERLRTKMSRGESDFARKTHARTHLHRLRRAVYRTVTR